MSTVLEDGGDGRQDSEAIFSAFPPVWGRNVQGQIKPNKSDSNMWSKKGEWKIMWIGHTFIPDDVHVVGRVDFHSILPYISIRVADQNTGSRSGPTRIRITGLWSWLDLIFGWMRGGGVIDQENRRQGKCSNKSCICNVGLFRIC